MDQEQISLIQIEKELICQFGRPTVRYDHAFIVKNGDQKFAFLIDKVNDIVYGSGNNNKYGTLATGDEEDIIGEFKRIDNLSGRNIIEFDAGLNHVLAKTKNGEL